jgi:hypothetical protein
MWFKGIMETSWHGIYAYRSSEVMYLHYSTCIQLGYVCRCGMLPNVHFNTNDDSPYPTFRQTNIQHKSQGDELHNLPTGAAK